MIPSNFDPARDRRAMLNVLLPNMYQFFPADLKPTRLPGQLFLCINSLTKCYWLDLVEEARPFLSDIVDWLDGQSPPPLENWNSVDFSENSGWFAHAQWWQSLGLAKWLHQDILAQEEFVHALGAEGNCWIDEAPDQEAHLQDERQDMLQGILALALAAGLPDAGQRRYNETSIRSTFFSERPVLEFGRWACEHLASGGKRDDRFIARGEAMLKESLLSYFYPLARWQEQALWLKAIYFDSGVTKTAEETLLRVYDCLPGVPRPDFLQKRG